MRNLIVGLIQDFRELRNHEGLNAKFDASRAAAQPASVAEQRGERERVAYSLPPPVRQVYDHGANHRAAPPTARLPGMDDRSDVANRACHRPDAFGALHR